MSTDANETERQPSSDPEMPVPAPPRSNVVAQEPARSEVVNEEIEDRFEATDN